MKELILIRGLPGAGKSTIAQFFKTLNDGHYPVYEITTDDYWEHRGIDFDPELLDEAHGWTQERVMNQMEVDCPFVIVHNTFTQRWEMQPYEEMAEKFDYRVHHIVAENRHGSDSTSDVPQKTIDKMEQRFQIKLQ